MRVYDVIFEDPKGRVELLKSEVPLRVAKDYARRFRENFPDTIGVDYELHILPCNHITRQNLVVVTPDMNTSFPLLKFKMQCSKQPASSKEWFEGFEQGKVFTAVSIPAAQAQLDYMCELAGTKEDKHWKEYSPTAVLIKDKPELDI